MPAEIIDARGIPITGNFNIFKYKVNQARKTATSYLNLTVQFPLPRWILAAVLTLGFCLRVFLSGHFFLVFYFLYIYVLLRLVLFLSPIRDPSINEPPAAQDPTDLDAVYHPFVRQLPEFDFWKLYCTAHFVAIIASCIPAFDIPVYWPVLVIYLIVLTASTLFEAVRLWRRSGTVPFEFLRPMFGLPVKPRYMD